jgi:hypothetical protein
MTFTANDAYKLCNWLDTATTLPPPTAPSGWNLLFTPAYNKQNYAVILQNATDSHQLAIVILGTRNPFQVMEDFAIDNPGPFNGPWNTVVISDAEIANGASSALTDVLGLTATVSGQVQSFKDFITSTDWSNNSVLITGHSLGGTITSVLAPWLASHILNQQSLVSPLPPQIQAVTFAAFAAGNQQFASYLNNSQQYQPHINTNDVVPHVWATSGPFNVNQIYSMFPSPGPAMPHDLQHWLQRRVAKIPAGFQYVQTNEPNTFSGTIKAAPSFSQCPEHKQSTLQWTWELDLQHNYAYCVQYIGSGCIEPDSTKC